MDGEPRKVGGTQTVLTRMTINQFGRHNLVQKYTMTISQHNFENAWPSQFGLTFVH